LPLICLLFFWEFVDASRSSKFETLSIQFVNSITCHNETQTPLNLFNYRSQVVLADGGIQFNHWNLGDMISSHLFSFYLATTFFPSFMSGALRLQPYRNFFTQFQLRLKNFQLFLEFSFGESSGKDFLSRKTPFGIWVVSNGNGRPRDFSRFHPLFTSIYLYFRNLLGKNW
jgi:hypothetical protein